MSKVSYANLKLKVDTNVNTFDFQGNTIEVLKYLPFEDKYDLVIITLQKALEDGIYNSMKVEMFFHLHLVYMYTNLSFTDKQKENEFKLYDTLKSQGFIYQLLNTMEDEEYNFLCDTMNEIIESRMKYNLSTAAIIKGLINDLPINAESAMQIVDSFDKDKYQEVIKFAEAANGGRSIRGLRQNVHPIDDVAVKKD